MEIILVIEVTPAQLAEFHRLTAAVEKAKSDVAHWAPHEKRDRNLSQRLISADREVEELEEEMQNFAAKVNELLFSAQYSKNFWLHFSDKKGQEGVKGLEEQIIRLRKRYNSATYTQQDIRTGQAMIVDNYTKAKRELAEAQKNLQQFLAGLMQVDFSGQEQIELRLAAARSYWARRVASR